MSKTRPRETAKELCSAYRLGRVIAFFEEPGTERAEANAGACENLKARFIALAHREGLSQETIDDMLAEADDAVSEAREKLLTRN